MNRIDNNVAIHSHQEIRAYKQAKHHQFVLKELSKVRQVSRHDHQVMLAMLVAEARRQDRARGNDEKWKRMLQLVRAECRTYNNILVVSPDPYEMLIAKLSSMMLWSRDNQREWELQYCEHKVHERQVRQQELLSQLSSTGKLFV